jgi:hypothetical protein
LKDNDRAAKGELTKIIFVSSRSALIFDMASASLGFWNKLSHDFD